MSTLQLRLKNCLQTILELEPDLRSGRWGRCFDAELRTLRQYLRQVDQMDLAEDDVRRLETATTTLLAELRRTRRCPPRNGRILQ